MSAPLKPHWTQPSYPDIQEVLIGANGDAEFTTKSISRVELPPFALFAPMSSPPVTPAAAATYATVQVGRNQHINLNSDLLYINHSCEPSLVSFSTSPPFLFFFLSLPNVRQPLTPQVFDTASRKIWVGPKGLRPGDELTFFYPSTEWDMAQPFSCFCGTPSCRGRISGARNMSHDQLAGLWLNGHIWDLLAEADAQKQQQQQQQAVQTKLQTTRPENGTSAPATSTAADATELALQNILTKAEATLGKADEAAEAARHALAVYRTTASANGSHSNALYTNGNGNGYAASNGAGRRGASSRELGGEMGGDTART